MAGVTVAAAVLLGLHAVLAWLLRAPGITTAQDDAIYLLLARGLGKLAYHNPWLVDAPPQAQYPPLYPALLAGVQAIFGRKLDVALLLNVGLSTAALGVMFSLVRRWSATVALAALAVCAVNPGLVQLAGLAFSEPLFMLCSLLVLWYLAGAKESSGRTVGASGFALAAALSRILGVAVVAAVFLQWLIERRFRTATVFAATSAIVLGAWFAWMVRAPRGVAGQSYLADIVLVGPTPGQAPRLGTTVAPVKPASARGLPAVMVWRAVKNLRIYVTDGLPSALALPAIPNSKADNWAWLVVLVVLGGIGIVELARRVPGATALLAGYSFILLIWPYTLERFVVPMVPLAIVGLLLGANRVGGQLGTWVAWALPAFLAAIVAASGLSVNLRRLEGLSGCDRTAPYQSPPCFGPDERAFFAAAFRVAAEAPREAVFLTPKAPTLYYLTGLRSVDVYRALTLSPEQLRVYLSEKGTRYIVLSTVRSDQRLMARKLSAQCREWDLLAEYPGGTLLLQRAALGGPGRDDPTPSCDAIQRFVTGPR